MTQRGKISSSVTTAESIRLLASMLLIAEKQKDKEALNRYISKIGVSLNTLIQESESWPSVPKK